METFWTQPDRDTESGAEIEETIVVGAGDAFGAQFRARFDTPLRGAKKLVGSLVFPERTRISCFNGSLRELKKLCLAKNSGYGVIHDPRWDHFR